MEWKKIVKLQNIPKLGSRIIKTTSQEIAVFRCSDDQVFAVHNSCPHQGGALSEGIVHGHKVTCPLHNLIIDLENGQAQGNDEGQAACFETKIEADIVYLKI